MPRSGLALLLLGLPGFVLGGCMQSTLARSSNAVYPGTGCWPIRLMRGDHPEPRHIVDYTRKGSLGSWSIPTSVTSITSCRKVRRSATA